ncbi:unnamed protein product [Staurois parvus]|uniref:Histone H2A n=1 Tax=Staurois parvus TaxID=386267 RepID=A0ABN9BNX8_9NEOB|nr:unnamed protein product [Staurois parvus]
MPRVAIFPFGRGSPFCSEGQTMPSRVGAREELPSILAAFRGMLTAEILVLDGNAARDNKKTRIIPRQLQLAVRNVEELNKLWAGPRSPIAQGGGPAQKIQAWLLPKKSPSAASASSGEIVLEVELRSNPRRLLQPLSRYLLLPPRITKVLVSGPATASIESSVHCPMYTRFVAGQSLSSLRATLSRVRHLKASFQHLASKPLTQVNLLGGTV